MKAAELYPQSATQARVTTLRGIPVRHPELAVSVRNLLFGACGWMRNLVGAQMLSQTTLVRMMEVLETAVPRDLAARLLHENEFPEWFIKHAETSYRFDWENILKGCERH
jgi:hypothetical protein